jgi:hypothetical protein
MWWWIARLWTAPDCLQTPLRRAGPGPLPASSVVLQSRKKKVPVFQFSPTLGHAQLGKQHKLSFDFYLSILMVKYICALLFPEHLAGQRQCRGQGQGACGMVSLVSMDNCRVWWVRTGTWVHSQTWLHDPDQVNFKSQFPYLLHGNKKNI